LSSHYFFLQNSIIPRTQLSHDIAITTCVSKFTFLEPHSALRVNMSITCIVSFQTHCQNNLQKIKFYLKCMVPP
jgi:hypothetical protein